MPNSKCINQAGKKPLHGINNKSIYSTMQIKGYISLPVKNSHTKSVR